MSIEFFIFKTARFFSLGLAILFLFLKYYQLPENVAVVFNRISQPEGFLPKSQYFYLISGLLIGINLLTPLLIAIIKKYPLQKLSFFQIFFTKKIENKELILIFENWINLIIAIINSVLIVSILVLAKLNSTEYNISIFEFQWLYKSFFVLIFIIVLYPFFKFWFISPKDID